HGVSPPRHCEEPRRGDEAIQGSAYDPRLLRRFAPRNDEHPLCGGRGPGRRFVSWVPARGSHRPPPLSKCPGGPICRPGRRTGSGVMRLTTGLKSNLCGSAAALALAIMLVAAPAGVSAQPGPDGIRVGDADLGGVVTGPNGPEAGAWVIAETTDLPTRMAKMVVTDERGRYVLPDLPAATY